MKDSSPARMKKNQIQVHTQHTTKCYWETAQRQVKIYLDNDDQGESNDLTIINVDLNRLT